MTESSRDPQGQGRSLSATNGLTENQDRSSQLEKYESTREQTSTFFPMEEETIAEGSKGWELTPRPDRHKS